MHILLQAYYQSFPLLYLTYEELKLSDFSFFFKIMLMLYLPYKEYLALHKEVQLCFRWMSYYQNVTSEKQ